MAAQTLLLDDGTRVDRPRAEPRVKLMVRARLDTVLPGGHGVPATDAPVEVVCYASDAPKILELVEERADAIETAKQMAETQYKQWLTKKAGEDAVEAEARGKPNPEFNRDTWGGSVEKCFYELVGVRKASDGSGRVFSGIKPLISVEKAGDLPAPRLPQAIEHDGTPYMPPNTIGQADIEALIEQRVNERVEAAVAAALGKSPRARRG